MKKPCTIIPGTTPPRSWLQLNKTDYCLLLILVLILLLMLWNIFMDNDKIWHWDRLLPYIIFENNQGTWQLGMLGKGFFMTIRLGLWSFLVAMIFGIIVGTYTANRRGLSVLPCTLFVQTLRNIPPLIFIFLIYFFSGQFFSDAVMVLQDFTYTLSPQAQEIMSYIFSPPMQMEGMTSAILALGIYEGAYIAEIIRSSIESIPKMQREAAASLGFSKFQSLWLIQFPQAKPVMLPPLAGQTVSIFKDSALAALVSLPELTFQSLEVMAVTRLTFEVWIVCMCAYFLISRICTLIFNYLENRIRWKAIN